MTISSGLPKIDFRGLSTWQERMFECAKLVIVYLLYTKKSQHVKNPCISLLDFEPPFVSVQILFSNFSLKLDLTHYVSDLQNL